MEELSFEGRKVLITGAGRGIGRAYALLLASRGAAVAVVDLGSTTDGSGVEDSDPAADVAAEITAAGGTAIGIRADISTQEGAAEAVSKAVEGLGGLNSVINNAGIVWLAPFTEVSREEYQRQLDVHFFGTLWTVKAAWPHLVESGSGRVVNTISAAMLGNPFMTPYGSSKGAVFGLTRNLALDGLTVGVKVNAIAPGAGTRMADAAADSLPPEIMEYMRTAMTPELVAPVGAYLVHEDTDVTGEVFNAAAGGVNRMAIVNTAGIYDTELTIEAVAGQWDRIMTLDENAQPQVVALPEMPELAQ